MSWFHLVLSRLLQLLIMKAYYKFGDENEECDWLGGNQKIVKYKTNWELGERDEYKE